MASGAVLARTVLLSGMLACAALCEPVDAAETVTVGTVGSASANLWPVFIGIDKGLFAAQDIKIDLIYVQSSAAVVQQLAAGSLDVTMSTGLVDPIRAVARGAPIAIVGFETRSPPYALVAKPSISSIVGLKNKSVSVGGPKDITRIYLERMLTRSGLKPAEVDLVFAGATAARASALTSGAVDAALLLPPFNFQAVANGARELGRTIDYSPELPFSGTVVNVAWAKNHADLLRRLLEAHQRSLAWFDDVRHRAEAVDLMVAVSHLARDEVEKSYDFFHDGRYFASAGKVSISGLKALAAALKTLGDVPDGFDADRLLLPGVTAVTTD